MNVLLKVGQKVKIMTPSCATQPYGIGKKLVGKIGTVIWQKTFFDPIMQGICVLVDDPNFEISTELISAWSYFTGTQFIIVSPALNYCDLCELKGTTSNITTKKKDILE